MEKQIITTPFIRLDTFLKLTGMADTGGHAKHIIQSGLVRVNGEICTMRGKKLTHGDKVDFGGRTAQVENAQA